MSSSSYGSGIQMQSLGQGLAAAASMYATLSMQGKKLENERTDAEARKLEAENARNGKKADETKAVVAEFVKKEEDDEKEKRKKALEVSQTALLSSIGNKSATGNANQISNDSQYGALKTVGAS